MAYLLCGVGTPQDPMSIRQPDTLPPPTIQKGQLGPNGKLKTHQCEHCLKFFASVHQLAQHVRSHTGEKPYRCDYCDRRFKQLSHLQQHTRLHTGERPYKCQAPGCGRAFIQLSNLQQHHKTHDGPIEAGTRSRPYRCTICGKGFAAECSLHVHTTKQHAGLAGAGSSLSCPVCFKLVPGSKALLDHMRSTHEGSAGGPVTPGGHKKKRTRKSKTAADTSRNVSSTCDAIVAVAPSLCNAAITNGGIVHMIP